jgi:hypothetical protein
MDITQQEANMMTTSRRNYGKIDYANGSGGFLDPPTHPHHTKSVRSSYGDTYTLSLESAAQAEWLNSATKAQAKGILSRWQPLPLEDERTQAWILQVLGYFKNCYKGDGPEPECWHAGNLKIDNYGSDDDHAGVHLIRKYYPEFVPTQEHWNNAKYGS